jgi:hypothetical protein
MNKKTHPFFQAQLDTVTARPAVDIAACPHGHPPSKPGRNKNNHFIPSYLYTNYDISLF